VTIFDIVGDVHGEADKLVGLLQQLGYRERDGAFKLSGHQAILVGDLIDRGPQQAKTLHLVRSMVDAGSAQVIMGNHEFNAVAFATEALESPGDFLRTHKGAKGARNLRDEEAFLAEFPFGSPIHREVIAWFRRLPLWVEHLDFRAVHACWHQHSIETLARATEHSGSTPEALFLAMNRKDSSAKASARIVLKGPEVRLSAYGAPAFKDMNGDARDRARIRWWDSGATTLREVALIPQASRSLDGQPYGELPSVACSDGARYRYGISEKPVFFGHYGMPGLITVLGPNTACLDFSAGNPDAPLVAYRFDGDRTLSDDGLVSYPR